MSRQSGPLRIAPLPVPAAFPRVFPAFRQVHPGSRRCESACFGAGLPAIRAICI